MLQGTEVTITDMMHCRERRANIQEDYLQKKHSPVISFCLNIPGPVKTNTQIRKLFDHGKAQILSVLPQISSTILAQSELHEITGDELILCVSGDASTIKSAMQQIEEADLLGRLFDIDVIAPDGHKLSRPAYRKCLLCGCQAQECARSRKHSVKEMQDKIEELLETYL